MNIVEKQKDFVLSQIPRVFELIDRDPTSPTYGCADTNFWRDKSTDHADVRKQEICFTLAILYSENKNPVFLETIKALLSFWVKQQYSNGSFDEWYKGERAYAGCAFSVHAVARCLLLTESSLCLEFVSKIKQALERSCKWLTQRSDYFKSNHEAVGIAALAFAGKVLNNKQHLQSAKDKLAQFLLSIQKDGHYLEIGQVDIGYTYLTVEYLLMANEILKIPRLHKEMMAPIEFALSYTHPNFEHNPDHSICKNPYVSFYAILEMAPHSPFCAYAVNELKRFQDKSGHYHHLSDDVRFLRWSFQVLLASEKLNINNEKKEKTPPPLFEKSGNSQPEIIFKKLGIEINTPMQNFFMGNHSGGSIEYYNPEKGLVVDQGYYFKKDGSTSFSYNPYSETIYQNNKITFKSQFSVPRSFQPGILKRFILQLLCVNQWTATLVRKFIDLMRRKNSFAINQSARGLTRKSKHQLQRQISWSASGLNVTDKLTFKQWVKPEEIFLCQREAGVSKLIPLTDFISSHGPFRSIQIKKELGQEEKIKEVPACVA